MVIVFLYVTTSVGVAILNSRPFHKWNWIAEKSVDFDVVENPGRDLKIYGDHQYFSIFKPIFFVNCIWQLLSTPIFPIGLAITNSVQTSLNSVMISGSHDSSRNIKTSPYSIWPDPRSQLYCLRNLVVSEYARFSKKRRSESNSDLTKETTTVQKDLLARRLWKKP